MNNIKWPPVLIVFILSLGLLFGGYFFYQKINVEKPIETTINNMDGIELNKIDISGKQVTINVTFTNPVDFKSSYLKLEENLNSLDNKKTFKINIENRVKSSSSLVKNWDKAYFVIAEAIDNSEYRMIPQAIEEMKKNNNVEKANYSMDDHNIYIELYNNKESMFVVLPRDKEGDKI